MTEAGRASCVVPSKLLVRSGGVPMALRDPVAVYNAANNLEAVFVRDALIDAGLEAFVTENLSQIGTWVGGLVPELHKPQVWVERVDIARAKPVLDEFERRAAELRTASVANAAGPPIEAVCEECGNRASDSRCPPEGPSFWRQKRGEMLGQQICCEEVGMLAKAISGGGSWTVRVYGR
jgi:hypothetical protein